MPGADFDVLGVGHGTEDHVCVVARAPAAGGKERVRKYFLQPGGQVPTALVALQRWGLLTAYIGAIGDDDGGLRQLASLHDEGVAVDGCVTRVGVPSQRSFITVDASNGERTIQWYRDGRLRLRAADIDLVVPARARALLVDGSDSEVSIEVARAARRGGAQVVLDADEPGADAHELLAVTDIAIVPAEFALDFAGTSDLAAALRRMCESGPTTAVATLGEDGAIALANGIEHRQAAFPVDAVDSTSAGDVFHAGFLYCSLRGDDTGGALRFAAAAAALTVARLGGRASIPTLDAVRDRIGLALGG